MNLVQRFSFTPNLRTSKEQGQANFVNPGLFLINVGADEAVRQAVAGLKDQGLTAFRLPIGQLVIYIVIAGILALWAARKPARRAAKMNILEAITTE